MKNVVMTDGMFWLGECMLVAPDFHHFLEKKVIRADNPLLASAYNIPQVSGLFEELRQDKSVDKSIIMSLMYFIFVSDKDKDSDLMEDIIVYFDRHEKGEYYKKKISIALECILELNANISSIDIGAIPDKAKQNQGTSKTKTCIKLIKSHFKKITLIILNLVFNHNLIYRFIGFWNGFFNSPINSVFVAFPAKEEYASAYVYKWNRNPMRWLPSIAGLYRQNGKWGIMFVVSSTPADFYNPENTANLKKMAERTEEIRSMLRAKQKTFAGTLPGLLMSKRIIRTTPETDVTVMAVLRAEEKLRNKLAYPENCPLIIIGGNGHVGKRLRKKLRGDREIYNIDKKGKTDKWPYHLKGKKAILINITKKMALSEYAFKFWPELALLNETYPEPEESEILTLNLIGAKAWHIVGVKADSWPSFPRAYKGGIPCCAAWAAEGMEVLLKKLN